VLSGVRLATPADAAGVQAIYTPIVRDSAISFEIDPPSVWEMARRIDFTLERLPFLVYDHGGEIGGYVYAGRHRERGAYKWSVDVTVYIHERTRRSGVGRALYTSLLALLRLQGYCRAFAGITLPNAGSVGLHESFGFQKIGQYHNVGYKLGAWHDTGWWELELRPLPLRPEEPISMATAQRLPEWRDALEAGQRLLDRHAA
jgi:L-amino acid N-acyltransferase YncA